MKVDVIQSNLNKATGMVKPAASTRSTLPVLGNILLQTTEDGRLRLAATNLELAIVVEIEAKVLESGALTLPARTLADLVAAMAVDQVLLTKNDKGLSMTLKCGRQQAKLKGIAAEEFPLLPSLPDDALTVTVERDTFARLVRQTTFATATDDTRPALTGVWVVVSGGRMELTATDGFRLSRAKAVIGGNHDFAVIVPARSLAAVAGLIGESETVQMTAAKGRNQVIFQTEAVTVASQLIEGAYPDFAAIVPMSYTTRVETGRAALLHGLRVANIFARESNHAVRLLAHPAAEGQPAALNVFGAAVERGDGEIGVEATIEGPAVEIGVNVAFLSQAVGVVDNALVALEMNSPVEPMVVRPVGDAFSFMHIIMPMHSGR